MKTIFRHIYIIMMCGMAVALATSCESENPGGGSPQEGTPVEVTLGIHTRANAKGTPEDAAYDIEKIHSWWVVFVSQADGKVKKIVSRPSALNTYVEQEEARVEVPTGKFVVYSFANITPQELASKAGVRFTEGSACPDVDNARIEILQNWNESGKTNSDLPMTGKQNVVVNGRVDVSIEVVRAVAKVEVQFTNESGKRVQVNSLKMAQTQDKTVPLLPNYTWLESGYPAGQYATSPVQAVDYLRTYTGVSLPKPAGASPYGWSDVFYVRESKACYNVTDRYLLAVNVTREGSAHPQDIQFALTRDLTSIYRNDHIILPVVLSDFQVSMSARFYPPIGGYPAVITRESDEQFYCEFGTEGDFELYVDVQDTYNNYSLVYGSGQPYYTLSVTGIHDPDGILATQPKDSGTGEIVGRVGNAKGMAYVDVQVTVHRDGSADQIYDRRIHIIRQ